MIFPFIMFITQVVGLYIMLLALPKAKTLNMLKGDVPILLNGKVTLYYWYVFAKLAYIKPSHKNVTFIFMADV